MRAKSKKRTAGLPIFIGAWFFIFALGAQVGCDEEPAQGPDGGPVADPTTDASDTPDAITEDPQQDASNDAPAEEDCWQKVAGTYVPADDGCELPGFTLSGSPPSVNPLGDNGAVQFTASGADEATAGDNLILFAQDGHSCTLKCKGPAATTPVEIACENGAGGSCTQGFKK